MIGALGLCTLLAGWIASGCGPTQPGPREQAQTLLARLEGLDPEQPLAVRRRAVAGLATVQLSVPPLVELRDTCLAAHEGLIAAQTRQLEAQEALHRAKAEPEQRAEQGELARTALQASDAILARSHPLLTRCRELSRATVRRYR